MEEIRKAYKLSSQNLQGRDISQGTSKDGGTVLKKTERKRVYWIDMAQEKD
jgi:hypothetical protein